MGVVQRYRKREPIEVDAAVVTLRDIHAIAEWCHGKVLTNEEEQHVGIKLLTKRRLQVAIFGDYIYKDHEDFFHVVHPAEFNFEFGIIKTQEN